MADKIVPIVDDTLVLKRYRDMGDGTYAEVVSSVPGDGTTVASVVPGDTGQNALAVAGGRKEVAFNLVGTTTSAVIDVSNLAWVSIHTNAIATGTLTAMISNDNVNWNNLSLVSPGSTGSSSPTPSTTTAGMLQGPIAGRYLRLSLSAGTAAGVIELFTVPRGLMAAGVFAGQQGGWTLTPSATTGGTATFNKLISAATTNATSVKSSAGSIQSLILANLSAAVKYFKIYNKASAPTVGTDTPVFTIPIQPNSTLPINFSGTYMRLSAGIAYAITGAAADADATAVAAGDVIVNMDYV